MIRPFRQFSPLLFLVALTASLFPIFASAQNAPSLTLTVTPPLFQVTQVAGSDWRSQLKLVNSNNYDISVTVTPEDFHPDGETGNAVFEETPTALPTDPHHISGWIAVPPGALTIKRGTTAEIPFTIHVPENADPGGHYGALIVSTQPGDVTHGSGAGISSAVTSLLFLRVPGDVIEKGSIRDFYPADSVVETPDTHFILRFENEGNVHIIPQGEIVITNMWGKERGRVKINEKSTFGNVLPASTRKFEFAWKELDPSPLEVGRYKAIATIVYGSDGRQAVERTVFFWIIPWKPVTSIILTIIFLIWTISWFIRRYIRKMLELQRQELGMSEEEYTIHRKAQPSLSAPTAKAPAVRLAALRQTLVDERVQVRKKEAEKISSVARVKPEGKKEHEHLARSLRRYRPLIMFTFVIVVGISLISWYFVEVFQEERAYHVEEVRPK